MIWDWALYTLWPWVQANYIAIWLYPSISLALCALLFMGWIDGKKGNAPVEWQVALAVCITCCLWPLAVGIGLVFLPALGTYYLGKWARRRHDFLPNVLKRMGEPE